MALLLGSFVPSVVAFTPVLFHSLPIHNPFLALALHTHRGLTTALAFGWAICVLVYAIAHISGGQLNPAVSLALFVSARLPPLQVWWDGGVLSF